ncbi:hypothetical protein MXB_4596 [Myxobolus squamalis]|nr:hypothetical protein MXB_4596 [Myxobolus squamalis]
MIQGCGLPNSLKFTITMDTNSIALITKDFIMYTVHPDQLLMDLWLIPNDRYFNICKNTVTFFDSAAFTIPTKQYVADKVCQERSDQSKVDFLDLESPENSTVDEIDFRRFNLRGKILNESCQILLWLADDALCKQSVSSDRTYLIALHSFYQALVIMIFDCATSFFVPWREREKTKFSSLS